MIPFWMEIRPEDLIQGTAALALAVWFLFFSLTTALRRTP